MKIKCFFILFLFLFSCKKKYEVAQYLNVHNDVDYVGINTCKQCHMDIYNTFIETGMGNSFNIAKKQFSSSIFNKPIHDSVLNFHYLPKWKKDKLVLHEYKIESNDTIFSLKSQFST